MSLIVKALAAYNRTGLRGSYRVSDFLARRMKALHCVPLEVEGGTLYADLRISTARGILANPKSSSGEDNVMRRFVHPGDAVFDIGAHLGFYTLLLSSLTGDRGKVFAFEPNSELLPSLRRTLRDVGNVRLFECALSDQKGDVELFVPEDASMASLTDWTDGLGGRVKSIKCETNVLDEMFQAGMIPSPKFIKCDVEGAELSVLAGARNLLNQREAPVVMFELNRKAASAFGRETNEYFEYFESLERAEYSLFEVVQAGIRSLNSRDLEYTNIVAVPKAILGPDRDAEGF